MKIDGVPLRSKTAWIVIYRAGRRDGSLWYPSLKTLNRTRSRAILAYDWDYAKERRQGEAKCVRIDLCAGIEAALEEVES